MDEDACPIKFIQYMRPNGRQVPMTVLRPKRIADMAQQVIGEGYGFEAEVLQNGEVSLTIANNDGDHEIEVVPNGPGVVLALDRMVERFFTKMEKVNG